MRTFRTSRLDRARSFRDNAPTTAAAAAKIILDGVKAERWRILVGDDAERLDERVRQTPEQAYDAGVLPELCRKKSAGDWARLRPRAWSACFRSRLRS